MEQRLLASGAFRLPLGQPSPFPAGNGLFQGPVEGSQLPVVPEELPTLWMLGDGREKPTSPNL